MIVGYMAVSADGYIADKDGGVGWLEAFEAAEAGFAAFYDGIDRIVMGRRTFDQVMGFDVTWPYSGKDVIVVTSTPIGEAPEGVRAWHDGVALLVEELRADDGTSWIVGGAALQAAVIREKALDRLELFVMPVFLGGGVPLFADGGGPVPLKLETAESLEAGILRVVYGF